MKLSIIFFLVTFLSITGCRSQDVNNGGNPINRSLLIDHKLLFGIEGLPIALPKIGIEFGLHFRRLSPEEEINLELAKKGRYKGDVAGKPFEPSPPPAPPIVKDK